MTFAVIPAGGKSSRMGVPKLALLVGGRTVLELVIAALKDGGIEHILVVAGPHSPELAPLARSAGAHVLQLAEETADMRATVEQGLCWLEKRFHPSESDCWLLVPADHPTLDPQVVRQVVRASVVQTNYSIFVPTYQNQRGHPALVRWHHVAGLRGWPTGQGINAYVRQHAGETMEVPVHTNAILFDLDTPEDYQRLLEFHGILAKGGNEGNCQHLGLNKSR
jgi:CTP:molybdopterin cytidylyltransferase MocA